MIRTLTLSGITGLVLLAACGNDPRDLSNSETNVAQAESAETSTASTTAPSSPGVGQSATVASADGVLECAAGEVVEATSRTLADEAFDRPDAPQTPDAALQRFIKQRKESPTAFGRSIAAMNYVRQAAKVEAESNSEGRTLYFGKKGDGSVASAIEIAQGGRRGTWLVDGYSQCSPAPTKLQEPPDSLRVPVPSPASVGQ